MKNKSFHTYIRQILNPDTKVGIVRYTVSFIGVLIIGALLIKAQGEDPLYAAELIVKGAFGGMHSLGNTIRWATPCLLAGCASIIAVKAGVTNLGVHGQIYMGALIAAVVGYSVELPPVIHILLCIVSAGIAGVLWIIIPALLRLFFNINEYITTMMMNFIALLLCDYYVLWCYIIPNGLPTVTIATPVINASAKLPNLIPGTAASYGYFIAVIIAIATYIFYKHTIKGYELRQVGENLSFAKIGGVNVKKAFISIFVISGFVAGVCGGVEVTGGFYKYSANFSTTIGWEGIMLASIAQNNPIALIFIALIWGALKTGAFAMERGTSLNRLTVNLLQMIFVILVAVDYEGIIAFFKKKAMLRKAAKAGKAEV